MQGLTDALGNPNRFRLDFPLCAGAAGGCSTIHLRVADLSLYARGLMLRRRGDHYSGTLNILP
jgi:hypothetical protein